MECRKGNLAVVAALAIAIVLGLTLLLPKYWKAHGKNILGHKAESVLATTETPKSASPSAASSPSPSPTPTPSPEVLSGYCLNVPILYYHHIQPVSVAKDRAQTALSVDNGTFDSQMAYLNQAGYTTISASQLVQALISHGKLPGRSVIVTIDDGYDDFYNFALPIIQKYHIHVDLLIPTGLLNNPNYMTWDQLRAAISSSLVSVVNHTHSHANLAAADAGKIAFEIGTAQSQLSNVGQNPNIFGYPYGAINNRAVKYLQEHGFAAALSTIPGQTQCDSFLMSLHRTRIGGSTLRAYGL